MLPSKMCGVSPRSGTPRLGPCFTAFTPPQPIRPMKLLLSFGLIPALLTFSAAASPVIISSSLGLTAQGGAGAYPNYGGGSQSYSDNQTTTLPPGAYTGTASGGATWTIPNQPGFSLPPIAHGESSASASTFLSLSSTNLGVSLTGGVRAATSIFVGGPVMFESASASTTLDFQFTLDHPAMFLLAFNYDASHGHGIIPSSPQFSFSSLTLGTLLGASDLGHSGVGVNWNYNGTGLLAPDTYTLHVKFSVGVAADPLGDFEQGSYRMNFSAAATVPDVYSTALLLAPSFALMAGLATTRRRRPS